MTQPAPNFKAIETKNQTNLKAVKSGSKIRYMFSMLGNKPLLLIGAGHDPKTVKSISDAQHHEGEIEVLREKIVGKGELKVTGCKNRRSEFDGAIAQISKKKVLYV
jgi:hypothetical protein